MPYSDKNIDNLIINKISKTKYNEIKESTGVGEDEVYIRKDSDILGLPGYSDKGNHILKVSADGKDVEWVKYVDESAIKFETIDEMISTLNASAPGVYDENQTIYILERNVPDFWIYSIDEISVEGVKPSNWDDVPYFKFGYYVITPLEPSKVVVNSNITYSTGEPENAKIGDLWLSPTTAEIYELPSYDSNTSGKVLSVNNTGDLTWKEDEKGTDVKLDAITLSEVITGSEDIIVDLNEDSSKLEIHLDESVGNSISAIESNIDEIEANILNKQDTLISGSNIKTINNETILGSGNIEIKIPEAAEIVIDSALSDISENAVQNKVIKAELDKKLNSDNLKTIEGKSIIGTGNIELSYNDLSDKPDIPSISGLATTNYVDEKVSGIIDSSPETLNTLKELATAIGNDPDFVNTITTEVNKKVDMDVLSDVAFTGDYGSLTNKPDKLSNFTDDIGINNKLDKTDSINIVYGTDNNGAQKAYNISDSITAGNIPLRDTDGGLKVPVSALNDNSAISYKQFSDNNTDIKSDINSRIEPNPVLSGTEAILRGISLKDITDESGGSVNYRLIRSYNELEDLPQIPSISGLATETYVNEKVAGLINSAPETLDTLGELATAFQDNQEVIQALNTSISNKQDISTAYNTSNIVYSETQPENPVEGMIWLKPVS